MPPFDPTSTDEVVAARDGTLPRTGVTIVASRAGTHREPTGLTAATLARVADRRGPEPGI